VDKHLIVRASTSSLRRENAHEVMVAESRVNGSQYVFGVWQMMCESF
jgi:hypothetical protein